MTNKVIIPIALTLLAAAAFAGDARVDNIGLSCQDGQTVAQIRVNGVVRFTHQTEVAKDGRPYRVIVDVLSAQHHLGAKNYLDLPASVVTGIRTSQYAVKPEKVVRVVFDMARETFYRVESGPDYVRVLFPDKGSQPFAAWSAQKVLADNATPSVAVPTAAGIASVPTAKEKSTKQLNAALDRDRLVSLQAGDKSGAPIEKKPQVPTGEPVKRPKMGQVPASGGDEFYGPYVDPTMLSQVRAEAEVQADTKARAEAKAQAEAEARLAKAEASKQEKPTAQPAQPTVASKPPQKTAPAAAPGPTRSASGASTGKFVDAAKYADSAPKVVAAAPRPAPTQPAVPAKATPSKTEPALASKPAAPAEKPVAAVDKAAEKKQVQQRSTAHFRRDPADVRKVKGTMVAEFPKRLVVKYKTGSRRDPFETLINEGRVYSDPIQQKVPNIDGLRLVGVMETESGDNRALFQDADDYGYILKAGDRVRKGYVLRVEVDRVYFQIFEYGWSRTVALNLDEE